MCEQFVEGILTHCHGCESYAQALFAGDLGGVGLAQLIKLTDEAAGLVVDLDRVDELFVGYIVAESLNCVFEIEHLSAVHAESGLVIYAGSVELVDELIFLADVELPVVKYALGLKAAVGRNKAVEEVVRAVEELLEACSAEAAREGTHVGLCLAVVGHAGTAQAVGQNVGGIKDFFGHMAAVVCKNLIASCRFFPFFRKRIDVIKVKQFFGVDSNRLHTFEFIFYFVFYHECSIAFLEHALMQGGSPPLPAEPLHAAQINFRLFLESSFTDAISF